MDEFSEVKHLIEEFDPFFSGELRMTDEKNVDIYCLPHSCKKDRLFL